MFTLDVEKGDAWRKRRRVLTPAFSAHKLKLVSTNQHCSKHGGHLYSLYMYHVQFDICTVKTCAYVCSLYNLTYVHYTYMYMYVVYNVT